jgi:hypothetical protein
MKVTRHNYEEWFILYLDNELDNADRSEVELFVKENPDLQPEFDLLLQSQLAVDTSLVFPGKQQLLKDTGASISLSNYEEWLLSYTDDELNPDEKKSVEQFIAAHPLVKSELQLLLKTKLQPEAILFANKELLYRREEKVRVLAFNWRRIAIAASLILAVGTTALLLTKPNVRTEEIVADNGKKNIKPVELKKGEVINQGEPGENKLATNTTENIKEEVDNSIQVTAKEKSKIVMPPVEKINTNRVKQEEALAITPTEQKKSNELPEPVANPNLIQTMPKDNPIAMIEIPETTQLTIPKETNAQTTVTPEPTEALYTANEPGKKNKLRGFFRKVTRTFEKTTNIKATDDEDRLLLGGLAIKL